MSPAPPQGAVAFASYKLRFHESHVRALPLHDETGAAFAGPGVDLRGEDARAVLEGAAAVRAWLEAREPGIVLRALSIDRIARRAIVTLEPTGVEADVEGQPTRPRVLRFDGPYADELTALATDIERPLAVACLEALRRRRAG